MAGQKYVFKFPDKVLVGGVGKFGNRRFYLQLIADNTTYTAEFSRDHLVLLASRVHRMVDGIEQIYGSDIELDPKPADPVVADPLVVPYRSLFKSSGLVLGWDSRNRGVFLISFESEIAEEHAGLFEQQISRLFEESEIGNRLEDVLSQTSADQLALAAENMGQATESTDSITENAFFGFMITPNQARRLANQIDSVLVCQRKSCPVCSQLINPTGHICPRQNGYHPGVFS